MPKPVRVRAADHKCSGKAYKVVGHRAVHDRKKGEVLHLCPHVGATKALVEAGHLAVHVETTVKVKVEETEAAMVKADDKKGANHG